MNIKYGVLLIILMGCTTTKVKKQTQNFVKPFEGFITYKLSTPKPDMISEEDWKKKMKEVAGSQGYILQKNYYKNGQFAAHINSGLEIGKQVYNPLDSLHYAWQDESNTAMVQNYSAEGFIKIKEIIELDTIAKIKNIQCKAIRVNMTIGHSLIWYNPKIIYIEEDTYKGTLFNRKIINKIKTLPIKSEIPGMLTIELLDIQSQKLDDRIFDIPEFKSTKEIPSF